jgi:hypothetical protein
LVGHDGYCIFHLLTFYAGSACCLFVECITADNAPPADTDSLHIYAVAAELYAYGPYQSLKILIIQVI